jgi:hypothetical protein
MAAALNSAAIPNSLLVVSAIAAERVVAISSYK